MIRRYLSIADVIAIHDMQIENFGGADGLRDPGQLDAAIFRPQSGYYGTLLEEAAALWESLSQNHPFMDGNKRTAYVSAFVFLDINGHQIIASDHEVELFLANCYEGHGLKYETVLIWLKANTKGGHND